MDFEKLSRVVDSSVNGYKAKKVEDAKYKAYNVVLDTLTADSIGHGNCNAGAKAYAKSIDWSKQQLVVDSAHGKYVASANGVDIYCDKGSGSYFFRPSKVTDNTGDKVNISSSIEGVEIGKDDDNNKLIETQTEDGSSIVKLNNDNEVVQDSAESVAAEWNAKKQAIDEWYNSELANGNTDYGYLASELSRRYDALREEMVAQIPIGGSPVEDSGVDDLSRMMRGEKDPEAEKYDKLGLDSADDFNGFPGSAKKADSKVKDGAVVSRSARKSKIKDGGDIYWEDESGKHTSSNKTWRGVPGTTFIWHGEWSDPEVWYEGHEINGTELEEYCWEDYRMLCEDEYGVDPDEDGYDAQSADWFENELISFCDCLDMVRDSKKFKKNTNVIRLNDSYASDRQAEFSIKPDDMFNILVNGETTVAAPNSGLDVNEYAKSMIKVFKDIAKDTGNKLPNVSYTLVGNDIIFKVKDSESFATLVNNEDCGDKKYEVILDWTGGACDLFEAYAFNEEEALNYAVAWVEKHHSDWLMNTDMEAAWMEEEDRNNRMMYVDATAEGAREPHWIWSEYLSIERIA